MGWLDFSSKTNRTTNKYDQSDNSDNSVDNSFGDLGNGATALGAGATLNVLDAGAIGSSFDVVNNALKFGEKITDKSLNTASNAFDNTKDLVLKSMKINDEISRATVTENGKLINQLKNGDNKQQTLSIIAIVGIILAIVAWRVSAK